MVNINEMTKQELLNYAKSIDYGWDCGVANCPFDIGLIKAVDDCSGFSCETCWIKSIENYSKCKKSNNI